MKIGQLIINNKNKIGQNSRARVEISIFFEL